MGLLDEIHSNDKRGLFTSNDNFVNYSTGLLPLDYANAFIADVYDEKLKKVVKKPIPGILGGTFTQMIGISGSGKTTLAQQIGANITRPFKDGLLVHVDIEKTALKQRLANITGFDFSDPRLILQKDYTSIEDVMELINVIAEKKDKLGKDAMYEVRGLSYDGKPFMCYIPTVIILDSLYTFTSKKTEVSELEGSMSEGRIAKEVAQFFYKSIDVCYKYNISVICVNHIKTKINTQMFAAPKRQLMMLKPDESLPRGDAPIYMSANVFRVDQIKSNMYTLKDDGFEGCCATIQIAKTKTNFVGSTINVAFNKDFGFDPIFTLYEFAKGAGLIQGKNPYLYFLGMESIKFNRKDFRSRFIKDDEFRFMVMDAIDPLLQSLAGTKLTEEDENYDETNKYYDIHTLQLRKTA